MLKRVCFVVAIVTFQNFYSAAQFISTPNFFKPRFRQRSTMGLYAALAFPIDLPGREAYLGVFFEAIYSLPSNETEYDYPPLVERQIDRQYIYDAVQDKIKQKGYPGKSCLLRTICEVGMHSVEHFNGIFGDVLHLIFTPSTTNDFQLHHEYMNAESSGKKKTNCEAYSKNCSISFLDLVSKLGD